MNGTLGSGTYTIGTSGFGPATSTDIDTSGDPTTGPPVTLDYNPLSFEIFSAATGLPLQAFDNFPIALV